MGAIHYWEDTDDVDTKPVAVGRFGDLLPPGTRLASCYVVHEEIGSGGMAQVYRGEHEVLGCSVAIKVLATEFSAVPSMVVRFLREARASSKVRHENVVEVTDFGETEDGRPFMVMEYLEGESLGDTLTREGPLPWERARPMLLQILAALQRAHEQGVIHRDVKPENVFRIRQMGRDDYLKVFDFGIAKVLEPPDGQPLTWEGQLLGTPTYMSPEQCATLRVDARSDLYSVGVLAYEMLTGVPPFRGSDTRQLLFDHCHAPVPAMRYVAPGVEVEPRVERVIRRALAKDRDERFSSAKELADALLSDVEPGSSGWLESLRGLFRRR